MNIRYLLAPLVAIIMVLVSACGGGAVDAPEVDRPGYTTPTPETPAPHGMIETPTTPDVPDEPGNGYNGGNGADGQGANGADASEEPNQTDEPITGGDIGRTRHVELRTGADSASPSGLGISGRGVGNMNSETKQIHMRELAEDMNYAFAGQLQGPDGSPIAKFTDHFSPNPTGADAAHIGWITLDIKATGESILVLSADFNPRRAAPIVTFTGLGDHGGTRVYYADFNQFLTDRGA